MHTPPPLLEPVVELDCQNRNKYVRLSQVLFVEQTIKSWKLATADPVQCHVHFTEQINQATIARWLPLAHRLLHILYSRVTFRSPLRLSVTNRLATASTDGKIRHAPSGRWAHKKRNDLKRTIAHNNIGHDQWPLRSTWTRSTLAPREHFVNKETPLASCSTYADSTRASTSQPHRRTRDHAIGSGETYSDLSRPWHSSKLA